MGWNLGGHHLGDLKRWKEGVSELGGYLILNTDWEANMKVELECVLSIKALR